MADRNPWHPEGTRPLHAGFEGNFGCADPRLLLVPFLIALAWWVLS